LRAYDLQQNTKEILCKAIFELNAFLQVAGFRLYSAYGRQFVKLLHCVDDDFLADLRKVCGTSGHCPW